MPCTDGDATFENKTARILNHSNPDSIQHHEDTCSPFCSCNCCNTSAFYKISQKFVNTIQIVSITPINKTEYTSALFSNFHNSIWQPPQIS